MFFIHTANIKLLCNYSTVDKVWWREFQGTWGRGSHMGVYYKPFRAVLSTVNQKLSDIHYIRGTHWIIYGYGQYIRPMARPGLLWPGLLCLAVGRLFTALVAKRLILYTMAIICRIHMICEHLQESLFFILHGFLLIRLISRCNLWKYI